MNDIKADLGQPVDCIIDTSTPETLERDFYAWLKSDPLPQVTSVLPNTYVNESQGLPISQRPPPPPYGYYHQTSTYYHASSDEGIVSDAGSSPSPSSSSSLSSGSPMTYLATPSSYTSTNFNEPCDPPDDFPKMVGRFGTLSGRSSGTNQLGRMYSPGLPLSMADREQIVRFYQAGWKICDISKKLCVTHSCVSKILNRFRTTGSVRPKDAKESRVESPLVIAIRDYRSRLGMTRQSEIRQQLILDGICSAENVPSRSSINHILRTKLDLKKPKKK